ncbi:MAG: glycine zipper domain-containing protein [Desulfobacteraceae bacterium]|nr:glycine zipper domain-containing protein [Desulfobacteraceae bacterium]
MKTMKRMLAMLAAGAMLAGTAPLALAADHGVNGLVLGAGGGAILGQAIGRNTRGTLLGTAVGGVLGYMMGNEMDKEELRPVAVYPAPVAAYPAQTVVVEQEPEHHCHHECHDRCRWREPDCRETQMMAMVAGRPEMVVTTACWQGGEWVVRDNDYRPATQVVVIDRGHRHWDGGPPPGRGWRREHWREVSWRGDRD